MTAAGHTLAFVDIPEPEGLSRENLRVAAERFWQGRPEAINAEAQAWREANMAAIGLLEHNDRILAEHSHPPRDRLLFSQSNEMRRLARSLVEHQMGGLDGGPKGDPDDQRLIFRSLGIFLANKNRVLTDHGGDMNPLIYLLDDLFKRWAARGCEGVVITPEASGDFQWKTRPTGSEPLFNHWSQQIIRKACPEKSHYGSQMDVMKPWKVLRPGLETFLDGWMSGQPDLSEDRLKNNQAGKRLTLIGAACLALRSMTTLVVRRMPAGTAQRLEQLEQWMGLGSIVISPELASVQQAAWDRHFIEKRLRTVRIPAASKRAPANEHSDPVRTRKM